MQDCFKSIRRWLSQDLYLSGFIALIMFFAYLPFLGAYYPDGDELEIIMRGKHLSWGYVNEPFVPYAARFFGQIFGYHMESVRLIPLFCCSLAVFLCGWLTKQMGGRAPAQALASTCLALAPIFIIASIRLDVLCFDFLFWVTIFCLMVRCFNSNNPKMWLAIGVVMGLALINKLGAALLMEAILFGLCLTKWRRHLRTPWPYLGAFIAVSFIIPLVWWWSQHDWCGLDFLRSLYNGEKYRMTVWGYLVGQMAYMNFLCVPVWLTGLVVLLVWQPLKSYRMFAYIWLVLLFIFLANNSGIHYLAAAYPPLLAAGSIFLTRLFQNPKLLIARRLCVICLAVCAAVLPMIIVRGITFGSGNWHEEFLKFALRFGNYDTPQGRVGMHLLSKDDLLAIFKGCPDNIVYNFSFERQVQTATKAYYSRPFAARRYVLIYTDVEGSAAALDYYGLDYGLPGYACSRFTNYYWGLPEDIRYVDVLAVSAYHDLFLNENFVYGGECGLSVRWWLNGRIDMRQEWPKLRLSIRED